MARIIPGVQVTVVKEAVPPQLSPSGVLGLVGITEKDAPANGKPLRASSWGRFVEACGAASAYSLPEARQALANGVFELVVVPLKSAVATRASVDLPLGKGKTFKLEARAAGTWASGFRVLVSHRADKFDLEIRAPVGDAVEVHRNLEHTKLAESLQAASAVLRAGEAGNPGERPAAGEYVLAGGADATEAEYADALQHLGNESDVDMVLAAVQDFADVDRVTRIYSAVIAHCNQMSGNSQGRVGFGQVPPTAGDVDARKMAAALLSDRFVLVAPHGVAGAVAGRIGSLDYFESPTFKTVAGVGTLSRSLPLEEQGSLLSSWVVPVVEQRGRGVIVLRGLTTDGDQISVRRIADRAVRGVRMLGELFIGRLNSEDGRGALKQKIVEFLVQMTREGALVPSTDGKGPAFTANVHSSPADFAQGIVRVDIAVRPVRAIDFIYATIFVQV